MNYIRLWKQAENNLILNESIKLMEKLKQINHIVFARVKIKSWDELVSLYGLVNYDESSIYIKEDNTYFTRDMEKFCGEEFEIVIDLNQKMLFWIPDCENNWNITRHMVWIMEPTEFKINKNWPVIDMYAGSIVMDMWNTLSNNCKKSEKNRLTKFFQADYNLDRKKVKVKSLEQLKAENIVYSNGNINIKKEDTTFNYDMYSLCGKEFIADYKQNTYTVGHLSNENGYWAITRSMVIEI